MYVTGGHHGVLPDNTEKWYFYYQVNIFWQFPSPPPTVKSRVNALCPVTLSLMVRKLQLMPVKNSKMFFLLRGTKL